MARLWTIVLLGGSCLGASQLCETGLIFPNDYCAHSNPAANASLFIMPKCGQFKLEEATIDQMQQAMSNGSLTAVKLLNCYLDRVFQSQPYIK